MLGLFIGIGSGALISLIISYFLGLHGNVGGHHLDFSSSDTNADSGTSDAIDTGQSIESGSQHAIGPGAGEHHLSGADHHGRIANSYAHSHDLSHSTSLTGYDGPGPVSFQTLSAFFVAFGYGGALFLSLEVPLFFNIILSGILGLTFSSGVFKFIKFLWRQQSDSSIKNANLIGITGIVTTRILPDGTGEIEIEYYNQPISLLARSYENIELKINQEIIIVEFDEKGIALVSENNN